MSGLLWLGLLMVVLLILVTARPVQRRTRLMDILETWGYVLLMVIAFSILFSIEN